MVSIINSILSILRYRTESLFLKNMPRQLHHKQSDHNRTNKFLKQTTQEKNKKKKQSKSNYLRFY